MAVKKVAKQMEMFDDGGLKDEGGTIDPISGNNVPPGSTQEEVRDDIPAQLSEGEFVFPADVVRFIGLEKLMMMRQEAKMGLKKMEDMGQMGNSEEATMPDDMPFSLEDLDMEDDESMQEDDSIKMAEGGYVMVEGKPMPIPRIGGQLAPITTRPMPETKNMAVGGFTNPTGTYQVPTNIATQPSYFQNYQQSTAPFSPFNQTQTPIGTPLSTSTPVVGQTGQGPSFNTLMPQLTGKRETLEYRNDAGQKLFIPFIDGKPIYPIPEGYTRYTAETETTPETQPTVQSTSVRQDTGDGSDVGIETTRGMSIDKYGKGKTDNSLSVAQNTKSVMDALTQAKGASPLGRGLQTLGMAAMPFGLSQLSSNIGKPDPTALNDMISQQQAAMGTYSGMTPEEIDQDPMGNLNAMSMMAYGKSYDAMTQELGGVPPSFTYGYKNGQVDPTTNATYAYGQSTDDDGSVSYGSIDDFGVAMSATAATGFMGHLGDVDRVMNSLTATQKQKDAARDYRNIVIAKTKQKAQAKKDEEATRGGTGDLGGIGDLGSGYGIGASTGAGSQTVGTEDTDPTGGGTSTGTSQGTSATGMSTDDGGLGGGGDQSSSDGSSSDAGGATEGVGDYNIGGLAGKKKKKSKPKKMKRGGLASR